MFEFVHYILVMLAQANEENWLAQNGALLVAVLALIGTVVTGWWGWKQKRTPTGEAQLDDERQYRLELRSENRDLKAEVTAIEALNDTLTDQNRQLRKENTQLTEIKEGLEKQCALLVEEKTQRDLEIVALKEDVLRLHRLVTKLETQLAERANGKEKV